MTYLVIVLMLMLVTWPVLLPLGIAAGHAIIRRRPNRRPLRGASYSRPGVSAAAAPA